MKSKFPGWRHMTAAQRYNARMEAIFDQARRLGAFDEKPKQILSARVDNETNALNEDNGPYRV